MNKIKKIIKKILTWTVIVAVTGAVVYGGWIAYQMDIASDVSYSVPVALPTKVTFQSDVEHQIETAQKFVKVLKANHEATRKADEIRARAERAYEEATAQFNALQIAENDMLESVATSNPIALELYYNAGQAVGLFATSTQE